MISGIKCNNIIITDKVSVTGLGKYNEYYNLQSQQPDYDAHQKNLLMGETLKILKRVKALMSCTRIMMQQLKQSTMKKQILIYCITLGAAGLALVQCKKNQEASASNTQPGRNIQPNYVKAECKVPLGYTSCNADCKFSDCCVVWDPAVQTGGCECMLGFSFCKTEPIPKPKTGEKAETAAIRNIWIKTNETGQFFRYCYENDINVAVLQQLFIAMQSAALATEANRFKAEPAAYDNFIEQLRVFVKQLSADKLLILKEYTGA